MSDDLRQPRTFSELQALLDENKQLRAETERLRTENAMLRADNAVLRAALAGYMSWHRGIMGTAAKVPVAEPPQIT